jgi:polyketide synthase 12
VNLPVVALGAPPAERADAARNRLNLLATARQMLTEQGADRLTMDALAERAGLGKGTVFRRFGTPGQNIPGPAGRRRADLPAPGDLRAASPGPGATPLERLTAYGRARAGFMIEHRDIGRAALDGSRPVPARQRTPMSQVHIRMLLGQLDLGGADIGLLAVQLAAALDGPVLLYLSSDELTDAADGLGERIGQAWQDLVERACRP